jgi:DNA-directed RNA polymerase I, II, and III subunit RPABC3
MFPPQIHSDLWPLSVSDNFSLALSSSLTSGEDASRADGEAGKDNSATAAPTWRLDGTKSMGLADEYEYVMYGKVYKFDGAAAERV